MRANFASHDPASLVTGLLTVADWQPFLGPIGLREDHLPRAHDRVAPLPAIFVTPELVGRAFGRLLAS